MEIRATIEFSEWLRGLKDVRAQARIGRRIERLAAGNPGNHRNLSGGVSELRIPEGKGYRVYYTYQHAALIILLCGGNKASKSQQQRDIANAQQMASDL